MLVKTAPQDRHWRRRQTWFDCFWSREFVTFVLLPQYVHTIATYCHNAGKNASGKVGREWGKLIKNYQVLPGSSLFSIELWGTLSRTFDPIGWFSSSHFFVEQLKPIKHIHFRGTQNTCSSLNLQILTHS
jgi:hypothetical protein